MQLMTIFGHMTVIDSEEMTAQVLPLKARLLFVLATRIGLILIDFPVLRGLLSHIVTST